MHLLPMSQLQTNWWRHKLRHIEHLIPTDDSMVPFYTQIWYLKSICHIHAPVFDENSEMGCFLGPPCKPMRYIYGHLLCCVLIYGFAILQWQSDNGN